MDNELTWGRALKVWWSFSWRAFILMLLIMIPLEGLFMFFVLRNIHPGRQMDPQLSLQMASTMIILWPFFMAVVIALQVAAMRWALRSARWSDFRLAVLPPEQR
jgi:hypothetical protein